MAKIAIVGCGAMGSVLDHNAGRRCEVDAINGAIPRLGKPLGVATPVNDTVVGLIRARERRMLAG